MPPWKLPPIPQEVRHRHQATVERAEGADTDPEEAVEEDQARPAGRHQATVSAQHQEAAENKAEVEGVEVGVANDVANSDETAAEGRSPGRSLLQEGNHAKEEDAEGAKEAWGRWGSLEPWWPWT